MISYICSSPTNTYSCYRGGHQSTRNLYHDDGPYYDDHHGGGHHYDHHNGLPNGHDDDDDDDFYVVRKPHKRPAYSEEDDLYLVHKPKKQTTHGKKKIIVEVQDYHDDPYPAASAYVPSSKYRSSHKASSSSGENNGDFDVLVHEERYRKRHHHHRHHPTYSAGGGSHRPALTHQSLSDGYYRPSQHHLDYRPHASSVGKRPPLRYASPAFHHVGDEYRHRIHHYNDGGGSYNTRLNKKYFWDRHTEIGAGSETADRYTDIVEESSASVEEAGGNNNNNNGADIEYRSDGELDDINDDLPSDNNGGEAATAASSSGGLGDFAERRQFTTGGFQRRWDSGGGGGGAQVGVDAAGRNGRMMQLMSAPAETAAPAAASPTTADGIGGGQLHFQAIPLMLASGQRHNNGTATPTTTPTQEATRRTAAAAAMQEKAVFELPERGDRGQRRIYGKWSQWSKCSAKCTTKRWRYV